MIKMFRPFIALACALFATVLLVSCAARPYRASGSEGLPAEQVAVLEHPDPIRSHIIIAYIDGKSRGVGIFDRYYLPPGKHVVRASAGTVAQPSSSIPKDSSLITGGYYDLEFVAEPGKRYVIGIEFFPDEMKYYSYIKDVATGNVVSKLTPVHKD